MNRIKLLACLVLIQASLTGCVVSDSGERLATKLSQAAKKTVKDPNVWLPLLGAAVFALGDNDEDLTKDLSNNTPLFDSIDNARDASDAIRTVMIASAVGSSLLGYYYDPVASPQSLTRSLIIDAAALGVTGSITATLKKSVGRPRPEANTDTSFPSAHASSVFAANTLIQRRIDTLPWSKSTKTWLKAGYTTAAVVGAYARLEANKHFASDVLVGAALGHFVSATLFDTFATDYPSVSLQLIPVRQGVVVNMNWTL